MVSGHTGNVIATSKNAGKIEDISDGRAHIENGNPELAAIVAAWPNLPPAIRAAMTAMVNASQLGR
jgi:hypothetical protein